MLPVLATHQKQHRTLYRVLLCGGGAGALFISGGDTSVSYCPLRSNLLERFTLPATLERCRLVATHRGWLLTTCHPPLRNKYVRRTG